VANDDASLIEPLAAETATIASAASPAAKGPATEPKAKAAKKPSDGQASLF
jgi:hypothetical protein